ncbi:MAG: indole-3-glycerol phosphate synthase TrpC [Thiomargarita sp.]|nr:indole-3-glycerol phosphate synthase TrpC [Thiomargarita sp.]
MTQIANILQKICQHKLTEIAENIQKTPIATLKATIANNPKTYGFVNAIKTQLQQNKPAIIAEIKQASPSKGILRENFNPIAIAKSYQQNQATCLSILTDQTFFKGSNQYLQEVRKICNLPILRKDFIIDAYQIYEARAIGADCILLIVAILDDAQLHSFNELAVELELDVLVEVHNEQELSRALALNTPLIGINNRNLKTFTTDLMTSLNLLPKIPAKHIVISESGINNSKQVNSLRNAGINTFLVGSAFMQADDPGEALLNLFY